MTSHEIQGFTPPSEGGFITVDVDGTSVVVAVVDGQLYAFDDECPHARCPLSQGLLEGHAVVCTCHFGKFDITTGAVLDGPPEVGIRIWSAHVLDGKLQLESDEAGTSPSGSGAQAAQSASTSGPGAEDRDVTVLIEREHEGFRQQFQRIEGLSDSQQLKAAWAALADRLEVHASCEESVFYPHLVRAAVDGVSEAKHAIRDHNEIRDSVHAVEEHDVGSDAWWEAVGHARRVNEDHLEEEEREVLPDFRSSIDSARREELGDQWLAFQDEHEGARGLSGAPEDPEAFVARATPT